MSESDGDLGPVLDPLGGLLDPVESLRWAEELFEQREYTKAAEILARLDALERPRLSAVRELLARSYFHSAQLNRTITTAAELLDDEPTNTYAAVLLARAYERSSRPTEAAAARRVAEALGAQF